MQIIKTFNPKYFIIKKEKGKNWTLLPDIFTKYLSESPNICIAKWFKLIVLLPSMSKYFSDVILYLWLIVNLFAKINYNY